MAIKLDDLKVKLFTDGADKAQIVEMAKNKWIAGFTTNPSLLKKAGVTRLRGLCARSGCQPCRIGTSRFEVFSDDIPEMVAQGARHRVLGPERLRQAAGDDDAQGAALRSGSRLVVRRREDQLHRHLHRPSRWPRPWMRCRRRAGLCRPVFAGRLADFGIDYAR